MEDLQSPKNHINWGIAKPSDVCSLVSSLIIAFVSDPELEDPAKIDLIPEPEKL